MSGIKSRQELKHRLDQLWGWAKAGKDSENYLMDIENVDSFTKDTLRLVDEYVEARSSVQTKVSLIMKLSSGKEVWGARIAVDTHVVYADIASSENEARDNIEKELYKLQAEGRK